MVMILSQSLDKQGADPVACRTFNPEPHTPKKMSQGPTLFSCGIMELSDLQQSQLPEHGDRGPERPQPLRRAHWHHQVLGRPVLGPQHRGQDARRDPGPRASALLPG
uniref:Family with sequence similarity 53 member B n=1 Tax=Ovis aries TaxID=9940 RepID=A0AC11E4A5_SHEEP